MQVKVEPLQGKLKQEPPKADASKPIFTIDIATMTCTMHSSLMNEDELTASLEAGPEGFLVAKFDELVHTTELSNLMLTAAKQAAPKKEKKPGAKQAATKAKKVLKKPGAAMAPVVPAAPAVDQPGEAPPAGRDDYSIMWYVKGKCIGIRAKFGRKNQVMSFGGVRCTKTVHEMKVIAKEIVADLHNGMSVPDAKAKGNRLAGMG